MSFGLNLFADEVSSNERYMTSREVRSSGRAVRPRDSASLIMVRTDGIEARLLMGKRSLKHKFMPNKFVFPGGVVDRTDSRVRTNNELQPEVLQRLTRGCSESRARALAVAAVRETFEETGLVIGDRESTVIPSSSPLWCRFRQLGGSPRLDRLQYIARAITPPYRNRRYDARFFMVFLRPADIQVDFVQRQTDELSHIRWVTLTESRALNLPHITRIILDEVESRIFNMTGYGTEGPFIYFRHGKLIKDQH